MFAIEVQCGFSAAHALRLVGGAVESLHGHDFRVTVKISCSELDALGTVVDFHEVEGELHGIVGGWHNQNLNDLEPFKSAINPSAERIAEHIGLRLQSWLKSIGAAGKRNLGLGEVRITEAPGCLAIWSPL